MPIPGMGVFADARHLSIVGVVLFPTLLGAGGLFAAEPVAARVRVVGMAVTGSMPPEIEGGSLEEPSAEGA